MAKRDYYEVLGIGRDASEKQIKAAYRKLARKFHPDVSKDKDADDKFKEATEAYEVLSDGQKRKMYDQFGHAGPQSQFGAGRGAQAWSGRGGVDIGDFFAGGGRSGFMGMGLDDILSALRGGRSPRRARSAAPKRRGADINYDVNVDFMQAVHGMTMTLRMQTPGPASKEETLHVRIPAGVKEGSKVRVRSKGQPGPAGSGDLYILVHVGPHPYFRREGNDIYVDVPISLTEAALGAKVDVPTIDGMSTVTIPPGTGSGKRLRLRGKGVVPPGKGIRGDHYVVLQVAPPAKLSDRGRELLEEFRQSETEDPRSQVPWK